MLPPTWDRAVEDRIFGVLFDVFGHRKHHASELPTIKPTVAEMLADPTNLTFRLPSYDPDFPVYGYADIIDCNEEVPELEALSRWSMVLHNQYPWDRSQAELVEVGKLRDDDYVVVFHPRDQRGSALPAPSRSRRTASHRVRRRWWPVQPDPPLPADRTFATQFATLPHIEALAVVHGDVVCSNEDLVRNAAYNWSPMTAAQIMREDRHRTAALHVTPARRDRARCRAGCSGARRPGS